MHGAMGAAAAGKSKLGIPQSVGQEFMRADKGKHFAKDCDVGTLRRIVELTRKLLPRLTQGAQDEIKRGQPGNAGQFASGGKAAPAAKGRVTSRATGESVSAGHAAKQFADLDKWKKEKAAGAGKSLADHPMYSESDHKHLKDKGYSDSEIKSLWDRDHAAGKSPVNHVKQPDVVALAAGKSTRTEQAEKFTDAQLNQLREGFGKIKAVDPSQPTYAKMTALLDKLPQHQIKQVADANIKFLSGLARNRLYRMEQRPSRPSPRNPEQGTAMREFFQGKK